jgi:hypothetical protein
MELQSQMFLLFNIFWHNTGWNRRNVLDVGKFLLMLKYIDITQNTYNQSLNVTEIMPREKCGLLVVPSNVPVQLKRYRTLRM